MRRSKNVEIVAVLIFIFLSLAGSRESSAQSNVAVRASDIFPLHSGQLTTYHLYSTDTSGNPLMATEAFAAVRVEASSMFFDGSQNVSLVSDSTVQHNSDQVNEVHYATDALGDIHAYADANFMSLFAPASLSKSLTPPDSFINYFVLSQGGTPYHMLSLKQDVTYQTLPVVIRVELTGQFRGVEKLSVPAGSYDSAFHFTITANAKGSLNGASILDQATAEEIWLVRGVGIVKSNMPSVNKGLVQIYGADREMTGHWNATAPAAVSEHLSEASIGVYPNPTSNVATITLGEHASSSQILLFNACGMQVANVSTNGHTNEFQLNTRALPSGDYFVSVRANGGSSKLLRLEISR